MITLFTDPHLGLKRAAHTTQASAQRLRDRLLEQVANVPGDARFCLGDLFDRFSNDEGVIAQGMDVLLDCALVIGGNHDVSNRADLTGSLQLLQRACETIVAVPRVGEVKFDNILHEGIDVYGVPHHTTQELFDQAIELARFECWDRPERRLVYPSVLLLHCNYDSGFTEGREAALNLTRPAAGKLLESFDFIAIGHEHVPRADFDGRLQVLGNTLPLGFGEMADRFYWTLDADGFKPHRLWSWMDGYAEVDASRLLTGIALPDSVEFVRLRGAIDHTLAPAWAKALGSLWKNNPQLLMVKSDDVEFTGRTAVNPQAAGDNLNLVEVIRNSMSDERMRALFNRYAETTNA